MFDSEGLIVTIERLVAEKMNKKLGEDPLYSDFEEIEAKRVDMRKTVHVSFVGDSRIRQIFTTFMTVSNWDVSEQVFYLYLFWQAIPDYDRLVHPLSVRHGIEGQAAVSNEVLAYSKLQGLVSSLYSRALLVDKKVRKLSDFLKVWLKSDIKDSGNYSHIVTPHPDILVIGKNS